MMVWLNLVSVLVLSGVVFKTLRDYEDQMKQGLDPVFDPKKLGINTTDVWNRDKKKMEETA